VPFFPLRFLVVMGDYSRFRYLLAVFTSRTPRFYLLALIGEAFKIPSWILISLFAVLFASAYIPVIRRLMQRWKAR
jgi:ribonucleoside-triphosphate reductase